MPQFNPGDIVIYVPTQQQAVVTKVLPMQGGMQIYQIVINNQFIMCPEQKLVPQVNVTDEFERCKLGLFGTNEQFVLTNTTFKISNQSTNSIATMMASKTDFKPYQYIPLLKFLYSGSKRLLVADEVGLGKTIEAGHIMLELKARHELRNALIVCPNSLLEKWQGELRERFDLKFKVYGDDMAKDFLNDLRQDPDSIYAIVNYEKLRSKNIMQYVKQHHLSFDFVLCDEAHKLRNHTTATHQGVKHFIKSAKSGIFLTATPIMNDEDNLFWLLNLLDEQTYDNPYLFRNALKENAPFVKALTRLGDMDIPVKDIICDLDQSEIESSYSVGDVVYNKTITIHEKFASVPLYQRIVAESHKKDSMEKRIQMQSDISSLNELNGIFTRNRKKNVMYEEPQAQRHATPFYVPFTTEERQEYEKTLSRYRDKYTYIGTDGELHWEEGRLLGYMTLERQLASSLYAYTEGVTKALLRPDAKFEALMQVYNEVVTKHDKKFIVFAVYNHTIDYLRERFASLGINSIVINGSLSGQERRENLVEFRENHNNKVLIASEVGSEGLDMQFCDALVNYDLPWNPMVVEQRIGRIDRIGQKSPVINIYNMVMQDTIHEKIYYRLLDRIHIFTSCIGDLEAILDSSFDGNRTLEDAINDLKEQFYCLELTEEQLEKQAQQLELALLHEKSNLEEIEEKFQDTLTNDIYFRNEISSMVRNYRYITPSELINYVQSIVAQHLTTCTFRPISEQIYRLSLPLNKPATLTSFLMANRPLNIDRPKEYESFINSIRGEINIDMTFDREYARSHVKVLYIDPFHPLILACMNYFMKHSTRDNTFQFTLSASDFSDLSQIPAGEYFLGVYRLGIEKHIYDAVQNVVTEIPLLYNVEKGEMISGKEEAMRFMGQAQQNAQMCPAGIVCDGGVVDKLCATFTREIGNISETKVQDAALHLESSKQMEINRLEEYYANRIRQQEQVVEDLKWLKYLDDEESKNRYRTLPMQEKNLADLKVEREEAIQKVSNGHVQLSMPATLISLNHVIVQP